MSPVVQSKQLPRLTGKERSGKAQTQGYERKFTVYFKFHRFIPDILARSCNNGSHGGDGSKDFQQ
jgi:hypothetical protein